MKILCGKDIGSCRHDIVWQDIIVAKRWDDWYRRFVLPIPLTPDLLELLYHKLVLAEHLVHRSRYPLVIIMACRVTRPDHEVYGIFEVFVYPVESRIDQSKGGVAIASLSPICSCRSRTTMTCIVFCRRGIYLVERIRVEI